MDIHRQRGTKGLPLECVYRQLFNPELFLQAYGRIYRNDGAMTPGSTTETVDGMSVQKIDTIIGLLRLEQYRWTPTRRVQIPKPKGGTRPLGIPTWSDKLVQEALRMLLEPYYEQRFSNRSHGFRPNRGCHSALREIRKWWMGTVWFIEGDIKGCFDNIDHEILLSIIRRDIHDEQLVRLIDGLLRAGYMEEWRYRDTTSGTPQGGIISPLFANIYLNELDRFVEHALIPAYTRGNRREANPDYTAIQRQLKRARQDDDPTRIKELKRALRRLPWAMPVDPSYRRLRYIRYADDFLLGFVGPRNEAEAIRQELGEYLGDTLKLTLSTEKTLITHAADDKARFLGYEIKVIRAENQIAKNGKRSANGRIALRMPRSVTNKYRARYSKGGKVIHRTELVNDDDYTIISRYQGVLRGLYNYYCMAVNVGKESRMHHIKWILETSLSKTLARKHQCKVTRIFKRYQAWVGDRKVLQIVVERPGKTPLVATFGGIPFERIPDGLGVVDFNPWLAWVRPGNQRSEVVQRLLVGKCELCQDQGVPIQVHHIRKLADLDRPGRRPKEPWEKLLSARKRKTLVVCQGCHAAIHGGHYDGPSF
jgi:group II intron reverse transcriptase/maturase